MTMIIVQFFILNIINVILQTCKSLVTIRGGKWSASTINAITFGLYTVVMVYTNADFPLWIKVVISMVTNFLGVLIVKYLEERNQNLKLWKIEVSIPKELMLVKEFKTEFEEVSYSMIELENSKFSLLNFYCYDKTQTKIIKNIVKKYKFKYFITESKGELK